MTLPIRSVKYVVNETLRELRQITLSFPEYDDGADSIVFNSYIDMLISFKNQGIVTDLEIPNSIDNPLGNTVPADDLIAMLTKRVASKFNHAINREQGNSASRAYSDLMLRQRVPSMARNPIVSSSRVDYNRGYYGRCDDDIIVTTEGAPIVNQG